MLRWLLQRHITVIPKSVHAARLQENIDVEGFELQAEEMARSAQLDSSHSQFFDQRDPGMIQALMQMRV